MPKEEYIAICHKYGLLELYKNSDLRYPVLENIYNDIYTLSFLFYATEEPVYIQKILQICLDDNEENNLLDVFQKNYVYWQCVALIVTNNCSNNNLDFLLRKVFQKQVCAFRNMLPPKYNFISREKRNKKAAVVITNQFLHSLLHSPSSVATNICLDLNKKMGMAVCLINSAEFLSSVGEVNMHGKLQPQFTEKFNDINMVNYKDTQINFFQCKMPMPNLGEIEAVLDFIAGLKPYFIVNLGESNITADLCSAIVPVITYSLSLHKLPITTTQFSLLRRRKLTDADVELLQTFGKDRENVIDDLDFSFSGEITESKNVYSRLQFKIPEDKFIIVIAGNRLDFDISDEVFAFLREVIKNDKVHIAIIGEFTKYDEYCARCNDFFDHSTYLDYQRDYSEVVALCDLFVNPKRQGNGRIGLYAALKGLPIVTFANNDVANFINDKDFYANSYDEMRNIIYRYTSDKCFHNDMSVKIRKIAENYISRYSNKQIFEEMVSRSIFI